MCLQEPMKARVLMCDVIRQTCMTRDYEGLNGVVAFTVNG